MNERQRRFADEYIISGNVMASAIKAGYSENYAKSRSHELLENVGIKSYIDEQLKKLKKTKIATADEVLQVFTSILRQEITEELNELNPITSEFVTIKKKPSISEVIRAGAELMKRYPTTAEAEKLRLEIEKLKQLVEVSPDQQDKLIQFAQAIDKVFKDG